MFSICWLQAALANVEGEVEDGDLEVADLPAPELPAAAVTGDGEKAKKKRKLKVDEGQEASGSKDLPASPQVWSVQFCVLCCAVLCCAFAVNFCSWQCMTRRDFWAMMRQLSRSSMTAFVLISDALVCHVWSL